MDSMGNYLLPLGFCFFDFYVTMTLKLGPSLVAERCPCVAPFCLAEVKGGPGVKGVTSKMAGKKAVGVSECSLIRGGFRKWWYPTTMGFPTKNDHFEVFWGHHHLWKHPRGKKGIHRPPKFNSSPKKKVSIPKGEDRLRFTTIFSGVNSLLNFQGVRLDSCRLIVPSKFHETSLVGNSLQAKNYISYIRGYLTDTIRVCNIPTFS